MPVLSELQLEPQEEHILKRLGYFDNPNVGSKLDLRERINEFYSNLDGLMTPSVAYKVLEISKVESEAIQVNGVRIEGFLLPMLFKDCQQFMVAACTIGTDLEQKVDRLLSDGNLLNAMLLDEIGNAAISELENYCYKIANDKAAEQGLTASGCIVPGQEGFALDEQAKILDLVDAQDMGVELTHYNIMYPRKSTTLVVGMGEKVSHWDKCEYCDMRDRCEYNY
ncbi:MAG: hypothetical protein R6U44_12040 [Archaeoglobaceae archaeon]